MQWVGVARPRAPDGPTSPPELAALDGTGVVPIHLPHRRRQLPRAEEKKLHRARKVLGWPTICKLAHAFLWEHSYQRLKLAQLLGQLGAPLTLGWSKSWAKFRVLTGDSQPKRWAKSCNLGRATCRRARLPKRDMVQSVPCWTHHLIHPIPFDWGSHLRSSPSWDTSILTSERSRAPELPDRTSIYL
jgi:hypothetical protein